MHIFVFCYKLYMKAYAIACGVCSTTERTVKLKESGWQDDLVSKGASRQV